MNLTKWRIIKENHWAFDQQLRTQWDIQHPKNIGMNRGNLVLNHGNQGALPLEDTMDEFSGSIESIAFR